MITLRTISAAVVLFLLPAGAVAQVQSPIMAEGTIVAFQKYERHRVKPSSSKGPATPVEIWIIRVDRWQSGEKSKGYFLVNYLALYQRAISDKEINWQWRFSVREPVFHEADSCAGSVPIPSHDGKSYDWRPAGMEDFERTQVGASEAIPALDQLPCLIVDSPPEVLKVRR